MVEEGLDVHRKREGLALRFAAHKLPHPSQLKGRMRHPPVLAELERYGVRVRRRKVVLAPIPPIDEGCILAALLGLRHMQFPAVKGNSSKLLRTCENPT